MTRRDLALRLTPLPLAPLMLALAACGAEPDRAGAGRGGSGSPFGFELAMAGAGAAAAAADEAEGRISSVRALTPAELAARIAAGDVRLIDVRTAEEVAEGTIPGAEHMPLDSFDPAALTAGDDGREIVLYCRTGRRSAIAGEKLAQATGGPVDHLEGGILAWQAAGQATAKPQTAEKPRN